LHLWCEAHDATRYDDARLTDDCIVHATRGVSKKVRTIRCIHPWYDPYRVSPSDAVMGGWFKDAKWSGCAAVSVDWEGWVKTLAETQRLVEFARAWGIPLILVPKWTLDPSMTYYFGVQSQAEVVAIINRLKVPALLPWLYMGNSAWRRMTLQSIYRDNGYTGQIIGMTDGGMREGNTDRQGNAYNSVAETWEFMRQQAADGQSVGLFNLPADHKSLRYAVDLYK
jgi:hypothetical protein